MKKIILGIAATVILATGAIFVIGQKVARHHGGPGFGKHHGGAMMALRGLDLTDEQKAKVKEIMEASRTNASL